MDDHTIYVVVAQTPWGKFLMGPHRVTAFETHVLQEAIEYRDDCINMHDPEMKTVYHVGKVVLMEGLK